MRWTALSIVVVSGCVGADPISTTPTPVADAGSETSTPVTPPGDAGAEDTGTTTTDGGPTRKRVFVTSSTTPPEFNSVGGLLEADKICQTLATNAKLGGTFVAWLSDASNDAKDRVLDTEYYAVDGTTLVAAGKTALTGGLLASGINRDEKNQPVTGEAWTGTLADGTAHDNHCDNWTLGGSKNGRLGHVGETSGKWTDDSTVNCPATNVHHLYCFEK